MRYVLRIPGDGRFLQKEFDIIPSKGGGKFLANHSVHTSRIVDHGIDCSVGGAGHTQQSAKIRFSGSHVWSWEVLPSFRVPATGPMMTRGEGGHEG